MTMTTTYAGMDAHARTIQVALLAPGAEKPEEWQLTNEPRAMKRLARRRLRDAEGPVVACYEAGPGGFALQRQLEAEGIECRVIAPAPIPRRPGDRVKTDRRDARKLAELLRADLLTAVHPPTIGRAAGLAESSGGVPAFAGRCRGRAGARSGRSASLGGAEGAGARVRETCAGMLARASDPGPAGPNVR